MMTGKKKLTHRTRPLALTCAALAALAIAVPGAAGAADHTGRPQSGHDQAPATALHPLRPASGWTVTLTAYPAAIGMGGQSTVTATANVRVGLTPFYLRIYDYTTHSYVATCHSGTTCRGYVPWDGRTVVRRGPLMRNIPGVTYDYIDATISDDSPAYPPGDSLTTAATRVGMYPNIATCPPPPGQCQ